MAGEFCAKKPEKQIRFVSVKAERTHHVIPSRHVTTVMSSCDTIMWQRRGQPRGDGQPGGGGGSCMMTTTTRSRLLRPSRLRRARHKKLRRPPVWRRVSRVSVQVNGGRPVRNREKSTVGSHNRRNLWLVLVTDEKNTEKSCLGRWTLHQSELVTNSELCWIQTTGWNPRTLRRGLRPLDFFKICRSAFTSMCAFCVFLHLRRRQKKPVAKRRVFCERFEFDIFLVAFYRHQKLSQKAFEFELEKDKFRKLNFSISMWTVQHRIGNEPAPVWTGCTGVDRLYWCEQAMHWCEQAVHWHGWVLVWTGFTCVNRLHWCEQAALGWTGCPLVWTGCTDVNLTDKTHESKTNNDRSEYSAKTNGPTKTSTSLHTYTVKFALINKRHMRIHDAVWSTFVWIHSSCSIAHCPCSDRLPCFLCSFFTCVCVLSVPTCFCFQWDFPIRACWKVAKRNRTKNCHKNRERHGGSLCAVTVTNSKDFSFYFFFFEGGWKKDKKQKCGFIEEDPRNTEVCITLLWTQNTVISLIVNSIQLMLSAFSSAIFHSKRKHKKRNHFLQFWISLHCLSWTQELAQFIQTAFLNSKHRHRKSSSILRCLKPKTQTQENNKPSSLSSFSPRCLGILSAHSPGLRWAASRRTDKPPQTRGNRAGSGWTPSTWKGQHTQPLNSRTRAHTGVGDQKQPGVGADWEFHRPMPLQEVVGYRADYTAVFADVQQFVFFLTRFFSESESGFVWVAWLTALVFFEPSGQKVFFFFFFLFGTKVFSESNAAWFQLAVWLSLTP